MLRGAHTSNPAAEHTILQEEEHTASDERLPNRMSLADPPDLSEIGLQEVLVPDQTILLL